MANVFLDIDDSILKNNLLLDKKKDDEFTEMLKAFEKPEVPFALVTPTPGVCLKMRTESGDKGFINFCHTSEIPKPADISDENLLRIAASDEPSFVIPMSIGHERLEPDKSGALCPVYDIAVNTEYFNKCQDNEIFMVFTSEVMVEAVNTKFNKDYKFNSCLALKNRKVIGKLQKHRIEKREVRKPQYPKKIIEEINNSPKSSKKTTPISIPQKSTSNENKIDFEKSKTMNTDYVILQNPAKGRAEQLIGLFKLPTLIPEHVSVDVGENRIIVEASESNYLVDVFVPHVLDEEKVSAEMDSNLGILRLIMPLKL